MIRNAVQSRLRRLLGWLCPCRRELRRIIKLLEGIKMDNEHVLAELTSLKELAVKVKTEILTKLQEMETVPDSIPQKIAEIREVLGEMDAVVPDSPTEPNPEG